MPISCSSSRPTGRSSLRVHLAGRPGRIDQAIEVPLPDDIGRKKLVQLYGKGLPLGDALVDEAARRTEGVSAAFIKELMRRVAQASISSGRRHDSRICRYQRSARRHVVRGRQAQYQAARRGAGNGCGMRRSMTCTCAATDYRLEKSRSSKNADGAPEEIRTPASDSMPDRYPP